jgi:F-type H+-transporting ATPase subunit gamma
MSKRLEVKGRLKALDEIRGILSAMKNLAIVEMSKVGRHLEAQRRCVQVAEDALRDLTAFYGSPLPPEKDAPGEEGLTVLVGSERGFCGAFNESLWEWFQEREKEDEGKVLVVGRKLLTKFEGHPRLSGWLEGPDTAEEIPETILSLAERLTGTASQSLRVVFHDGAGSSIEPTVMSPFEEEISDKPSGPFPPLLQLPPERLYEDLLEQRLFFQLTRAFQASFMAENRERLRHMEGALQSLDKKRDGLRLRYNGLRQEEISEELEMILLGAEGMAGRPTT